MGSGSKVEMLIAVCALISSAAAVFIAWDQGRVMRAQQHGEVYPILQVDGFSNNSATYTNLGFRVRNSGVGPAIIESVELEFNGETVVEPSFLLSNLPGGYDITRAPLTGRALAPGEEVTPFELGWRRDQISFEQVFNFVQETQNWKLKICYCSVFKRCWQTSEFSSARADRVESCPRGDTDIFAAFIPARPQSDTEQIQANENPSADGANQ
ncbi:MAG: hypothetical protein AAF683_03685 [Pseudomonadota bacterium]